MKCDSLATTMKWHEISLYMHKPTSSPSRFHFHARKNGSCAIQQRKVNTLMMSIASKQLCFHITVEQQLLRSSLLSTQHRSPHRSLPDSLAKEHVRETKGWICESLCRGSAHVGEGWGAMGEGRACADGSAHAVEGGMG